MMPTDELERELRHAFARQATRYQDAGVARQRLLRRDYRPRAGHRRLAGGITAVAAAGAVALGLGLSGVLGTSAARGSGTIRTVAFTLTRHANGTATLTINPRVLFNPGRLQRDLARDGIPAKVTTGRFCSTSPAPGGFSQVVTFSPPFKGISDYPRIHHPTVTINPAAMAAGSKLSVGAFRTSSGYDTALALINARSYACTSTAPTTLIPGGALLHWNGTAGS